MVTHKAGFSEIWGWHYWTLNLFMLLRRCQHYSALLGHSWCRVKWNLSTPSTSRKDTQNGWLQWDHHGLLETDPKTTYDHSLDSRLRKRHTGVWANDSDLTVTEPWNQMVSSGESNMMVFHPVIRRVPPKKVARIMASLPSSWWGWLVGTGQVDRIAVGQCQGGFMYRNIAMEIMEAIAIYRWFIES